MATNPIKGSDLAEKGALKGFQKELKDSISLMNDLNQALIESGKIQKKNIEQLKKQPDTIKKAKAVEKAAKKANTTAKATNEARERRIKLDKQLAAAEDKLIRLNSTKASQIAELNLLSAKQNQINKEEAILNQKNLGTLERISVQNKKLIRERSKLNLETDEGLTRLREINDELDENNKRIKENVSALEQQKINIGNYKEDVSEAIKENELFSEALGSVNAAGKAAIDLFGKLANTFKKTEDAEEGVASGADKIGKSLKAAGLAALLAVLSSIGAAFTKTREGVLKFDRIVGAVNATLGVFVGALAQVGSGIIDLFSSIPDQFEKARIAMRIFFLEASQFDALGQTINDNSAEIAELRKQSEGLGDTGDAVKKITTAFDGFLDTVRANVKGNDELIVATFKHRDALRELQREIARVQAQEELQQAIADDATLSFGKREAAIKESIRLSEIRIEKQKELAEVELEHANEVLRIQLREAKVRDVSNDQLLDLINNTELSGKVSEEALEKQQEAVLGLIEAENELLLIQKEQQKVVAELKQDRLEKDLDILIDGFDSQKTINERLIADDRKTLEERRKIFEETTKLANESFTAQKDVLAQLSNAGIDVDELLKLDAVTLNERIRSLEQSEIIEGRTLEVVRERRTVLQDLADLERELNDLAEAEEKKRLATLEAIRQEGIQGEIEAQERLLENEELTAQRRIEIIEEIFELRKQALQEGAEFALESDEITAEERHLIAQKLQNDLLALENEKVNAVKDANQAILDDDEETANKRIDAAQRLGQQVAQEFEAIIKARNKENLELADAEIKRAEESVRRQEEIAANGQENILAQEQARLEKANLAKQREAERAAKQEQAIALATGFLNNLAARQKNAKNKEESNAAFALALRDTIGAKLIAEGLASFYDGTEDTGTTGDKLDSKGGRYAILHDNERVMTKAQNKKVGGMSNDDLANLAYDFNHGNLSPSHFKQLEVGRMMQPQVNDMQPVIAQMQKDTVELKKAFENGQVKYNVNWNSHGEAVEAIEKKRVRKIVTHRKRL